MLQSETHETIAQRIQRVRSIVKEAHLIDCESASDTIEQLYKSDPIRSFVKRIYDRIQNKNIPLFHRAYKEFEETVFMPEFRRATMKEFLRKQEKEKIAKDPDKAAQIGTARIIGAMDLERIKDEGEAILKPAYTSAYIDGGDAGYRLAGIKASFDVLDPNAIKEIDAYGADLITAITEETRRATKAVIKIGIEAGRSMPNIARDLSMVTDLPHRWAAAVVNYNIKLQVKGVPADIANKRAATYHKRLLRARRLMIARTETGIAQAQGSLRGYKRIGVQKVRFFAAHGACPICADLDGNVYLIEEAHGMIPVHPNGRCDWISLTPKGGYKDPVRYKPPKNLKTGIEQAIADIMSLFARRKVEHSSCLDGAGNVVFKKSGGRSSIKFYEQEMVQMRNARAMIHNHPTSASFSWQDIDLATDLNIGQMIVCSNEYRYTMAPATGAKWNSIAPAAFKKEFRYLKPKYEAKFWTRFRAEEAEDMTQTERNSLIARITHELNVARSHEANSTVAKSYKYKYTRTKVSGD